MTGKRSVETQKQSNRKLQKQTRYRAHTEVYVSQLGRKMNGVTSQSEAHNEALRGSQPQWTCTVDMHNANRFYPGRVRAEFHTVVV